MKREQAKRYGSNPINEIETVELIKATIKKILSQLNVEIEKIILFGSRARGDYRKDSDWDCFVVVKDELERKKKREIVARIKMELARLGIPNDIIIQSSKTVEDRKNDVGYLVYYVLREGIEI